MNYIPSSELTYPTVGKGYILLKRALGWDMLVSRKVSQLTSTHITGETWWNQHNLQALQPMKNQFPTWILEAERPKTFYTRQVHVMADVVLILIWWLKTAISNHHSKPLFSFKPHNLIQHVSLVHYQHTMSWSRLEKPPHESMVWPQNLSICDSKNRSQWYQDMFHSNQATTK